MPWFPDDAVVMGRVRCSKDSDASLLGTTDLEGARPLEVLQLEVHLRAAAGREGM